MRHLLFIAISALITTSLGCFPTERTCMDGYRYEGTGDDRVCVPIDGSGGDGGPTDGGPTDAGDADAQTDVGPNGCSPSCTGETPHCDEDAGECVACLSDTHCTSPAASRCDGGICIPCQSNTDCHQAGLGVCDDGTCVECTGTDFTACDGKVCDSKLKTCTNIDPNSTLECRPCVSDAQCRDGRVCVDMTFGGEPVGSYCLWEQSASEGAGAPNGSCSTARPYRSTVSRPSLDRTTPMSVCAPALTTCTALVATWLSTCTSDATCGVDGRTDAYCIPADMSTSRCTVRCGTVDDCPPDHACIDVVGRDDIPGGKVCSLQPD